MVVRYIFNEAKYVKINSVGQGAFNFRYRKNIFYGQHTHNYYQMSTENYSQWRIN
jgi:hypothetical protein